MKRGGAWQRWTYSQYHDEVIACAKGLIALGLEPYHSVGIIGFNSPEWFFADLGAIYAGGFAAGIYTTNGPEACQYVAEHSRAQIMVVEDEKQLAKILQIRDQLPDLKAIVQYIGEPDVKEDNIYSWAAFMEKGKEVSDDAIKERTASITPENCCTLIYTSGTTGKPKAVMISHDNLTWTAQQTVALLDMGKVQEHVVSYLPLSHIAAQMLDIAAPLCHGGCVWFAQPDALKGSLLATLKEVRPTSFLGVPRVWEKIQAKMKALGAQTTGMKAKISAWAKGKGYEGNMNLQAGQSVPWGWWLANKLVFGKVREALGLDRARFLATAAAPISKDTLDYFLSLNLPLQEIYGMSECTGPQTVSIPGAMHSGSTGRVLPGAEMKIFEPDNEGNGEICFRGRHIFMGYLFNDAKTKEAIDEEGWLHSGDVGQVDADGYLRITGRIKELLITAGGENVAPVPIEDAMKEEIPILSNVMVIGDQKKFLSMIITLQSVVDVETAIPQNELTPECIAILKGIGSDATTVEAAAKDEKVKAFIDAGRLRANKRAESRAKNVQKFEILAQDFSIPGGELGPTLKLRRPIVYKKYAEVIDGMY